MPTGAASRPSSDRHATRAMTWAWRVVSGCSATSCQRRNASSRPRRGTRPAPADAGRPSRAERRVPRSRRAVAPAPAPAPRTETESHAPQLVQGTYLDEGMRAGHDLLGPRAQVLGVTTTAGVEHGPQGRQRRSRLEDAAAPGELRAEHTMRGCSARCGAPARQPARDGVLGRSGADQVDREPDAEQAQPVDQVPPFDLGDGSRGSARTNRSAVSRVSWMSARGPRPTRPAGGTRPPAASFPACPSRPATGTTAEQSRRSRRSAWYRAPTRAATCSASSLAAPISSALDSTCDRVERVACAMSSSERLEEPYVAGMGVSQQIEHGVGDRPAGRPPV